MSSYYTNLKPGYTDILKRTTPPTVPTTQPKSPVSPTVPQVGATTTPPNVMPYANRMPPFQAPTTPPVPGATQTPTPVTYQGGSGAASASAAANKAGQAQQATQGQAMGAASANPTVPVMYRGGAGAASASAAATKAGQAQEQAQGQAMANASAAPSQAAGAVIPPPDDYTKLKDQGALTEAGDLYSDYVTSVLKGDRAIAGVDSARSDAERRNALNYTRTLDQAREIAAQSGLQPGTAGYQRIINEAMSGVASQNLDRTNSVNQLQRQGYQDILGLGRGLEDTSRANAIGERNYQTGRADTTYNRGVAERDFQTERSDVAYNRAEAGRLEKQTQEMAAINSIDDPKARQAALNQYLASQQGNYGSVLGLFNPDGSLKSEYASINPAQASYEQRIAELKAYYPTKTDAEIQAMAQSEREQERTVTRAPIDKATSEAQLTEIKKKIQMGQEISNDEMDSLQKSDKIPFMNSRVGPQGVDAVNKYLQENPDGLINLDGTVYKVIAAIPGISAIGTTKGMPTKMTDMNGEVFYLVGGKIIKQKQ